ncbi:Crp/Fnr family transcriptional regulator [Parapedobacter tibetensis]|uniref:Crp/Fnr family transcriptional regulator n=1 Tax=Parapedobacter tibetensis TaxID=2972951 RepID=UPI00214D69A6|nr:cyclic nucleotide-binding domain-containing protein [Parapedobacter tibetensis]
MHTFIQFWTTHVAHVPDVAIAFVQAYAKVVDYSLGTYLVRAGDFWPYWNLVLEGAVMALYYAEDGSVAVPWLVTAGGYFTGTAHAFTKRRDEVFIQALDDTRVMQLPNARLQQAQQQYHTFSELINILKQRRIEQDALLDHVFRQTGGEARVAAFFEAYPRLAPLLPMQQVCAILQISESTYKRGKRGYYRKW